MKKLFIILGFVLGAGFSVQAASVFFPYQGGTGTGSVPTYGNILVGNANGTYTLTATSSLGIVGAASSPGGSSGQVQYNGSGSFAGVATTTLSPGTNVTFTGTPGYLIGGTNLTINATGGGGTGLSTTSPTANDQVLIYSSAGAGAAYSIATTSLSITGPFTIANPIGVLKNGAVTYTGLATTSQPSSSNLLVSNGGAGVFGVATGTISAGTGISLDSSIRSAIGGALAITNSSPLSGLVANYPYSFSNPTLTWLGFSTTTNSGLSAGFMSIGPTGIPYSQATSSAINLSITGNAGTVTNGVYTTDTGTVTNTMLAGSITNAKLLNSSLTVNGTAISLGASGTITAASSTLLANNNTFIGTNAYGTPSSLVLTNATGLPNAGLLNSTISGIALGGTLGALTATNATLTFSGSYTGAAAQTIGLNLGNANTWSGLQTFTNTATTSFSGGISGTYLALTGTTATSTAANGLNLTGGCFAVNGTCVGGGSGSGTVGTGTTGQFPYYAAGGTTLTATSTLFLSTASNVGIGTTTPTSLLTVAGSFLINTWTNITNAFTIKNNAGTTVFNVDTTVTGPQLAVGTSTPYSTFTAWGAGTAGTRLANFTNSASTTVFAILNNGHTTASTTQPTLSACGTSPSMVGTDERGYINVGTGVVASCTMTFAAAYKNKPTCVVTNEVAMATFGATTITTLIVSGTAIDADVIHYRCGGLGPE